jgi:hypothetical protein
MAGGVLPPITVTAQGPLPVPPTPPVGSRAIAYRPERRLLILVGARFGE